MPAQIAQMSTIGQLSVGYPAVTPTTTVQGVGVIYQVVVNSSGSAATNIYDNSAVSGTNIIAVIPASPTVGSTITVNQPFSVGIAAGAANTSAFRFSYSLGKVSGQ